MAPLVPLAISLLAETVPDLIRYFGKEKEADIAAKVIGVAQKVTGKEDPIAAVDAVLTDPTMVLTFKQAVMEHELDIKRLALEEKTLYVDDVKDARTYRDDKTFRLGLVVLASFAAVMLTALFGLYKVVSGTVSVQQDMLAATIGLVGAIVGYFAANAQQVVSYFFGSSAGSTSKGDSIADAISMFKKGSK